MCTTPGKKLNRKERGEGRKRERGVGEMEEERMRAELRERGRESLVCWCFEPSQPLGVTSGLRERERELSLIHI